MRPRGGRSGVRKQGIGRSHDETRRAAPCVRDRHDGHVCAGLHRTDDAGATGELRFFGGLSNDEVAEVLKISADTVMRDWDFVKAWLLREMG